MFYQENLTSERPRVEAIDYETLACYIDKGRSLRAKMMADAVRTGAGYIRQIAVTMRASVAGFMTGLTSRWPHKFS